MKALFRRIWCEFNHDECNVAKLIFRKELWKSMQICPYDRKK